MYEIKPIYVLSNVRNRLQSEHGKEMKNGSVLRITCGICGKVIWASSIAGSNAVLLIRDLELSVNDSCRFSGTGS